MRMMAIVTMPTERGNELARDGSMDPTIAKILEAMQPESAYFTAKDGCRAAYIVFDLKQASDIPGLMEPWFLAFDADIELVPVMTMADMEASGPGFEAAVKAYG